MSAPGGYWIFAPAIGGLLLLAIACSESKPAATPVYGVVGVQKSAAQTMTYRIELWIGPVVTMPDSMMSAAMTTTDRGRPVDRHLEVHVYNKSSGAAITDVVPTLSITEAGTGATRTVSNILACLTLRHREVAPHYGDNVYLPDGEYTVTVAVGGESASLDVSL